MVRGVLARNLREPAERNGRTRLVGWNQQILFLVTDEIDDTRRLVGLISEKVVLVAGQGRSNRIAVGNVDDALPLPLFARVRGDDTRGLQLLQMAEHGLVGGVELSMNRT